MKAASPGTGVSISSSFPKLPLPFANRGLAPLRCRLYLRPGAHFQRFRTLSPSNSTTSSKAWPVASLYFVGRDK